MTNGVMLVGYYRNDMILKLWICIFVCIFFSCKNVNRLNESLDNGLKELENTRKIDKAFIDGYKIEEFAIVKDNDSLKHLIFELNSNIEEQLLKTYRVGVLFELDELNSKLAGLNAGVSKKSFDFFPQIKVHNNHKYIVNTITTNIDKVEKMTLYIYIYDGKKIVKLEKNKIYVKNFSFL